MNNQSISLNQIPRDKSYQGYLWYSNEKAPVTLLDEPLPEISDTINPFVIEGNLYDSLSKISYQIKSMDGNTLVMRYDLNALPAEHQHIDKCFLPQRLPKRIEKLKFAEVWFPEQDPLCEGMPVLRPAFTAFTGFKLKEE